MIPGMGGMCGMDPKKMQAMMSKLGIKQENIDAKRVVIERSDDSNIVIENPDVVKINMQGKESWQIIGDAKEEEAGVSESDVKLVVEKTGKSEGKARKTLEEVGGVAEAIVKLS